MLNKLKARKNQLQAKGGFTLVELIVVLVILAILAALLIPALTGYIDKAKQKNAVAECRQVVMAAQTLYDEKYGNDKNLSVSTITIKASGGTISFAEVAKLAEVTASKIKLIEIGTGDNANKIAKVQYEGSNGYQVEYTIANGYQPGSF